MSGLYKGKTTEEKRNCIINAVNEYVAGFLKECKLGDVDRIELYRGVYLMAECKPSSTRVGKKNAVFGFTYNYYDCDTDAVEATHSLSYRFGFFPRDWKKRFLISTWDGKIGTVTFHDV